MKKLLLAGSLILMTSFMNAQYLVSATEILSKNGSQIWSILNYWGWQPDTMTFNGAVMYKITYNTTDVSGEPTIASGALFVPDVICDTLPFVSYQHGTTFNKTEVPSNTYGYTIGLFYSGSGYITTMPDYLGLGDNPGIHPYVHWESEATASIDMIRAAREFINGTLGIWDNNQLFLNGYSQGGHSTMALHKYIEVNDLQSEFNVVASAPASGAFPLFDVQQPMMLEGDSSYPVPAFLPYALASYQLVYGNLYTNFNEYYDPPYDSLIAAWLAAGDDWGTLPNNFYDFMQDSVLDNMLSNPDHPINVDLRDNDLHNWIPNEPVRMLYCGMDSLVFPENSITASDTMAALGANDVQALELDPLADHDGCFLPTMYYALEWFDSLATPCIMANPPTGISAQANTIQPFISVFPNPFSTSTTIEYELARPGMVRISFYNQLGGQVDAIELYQAKGSNHFTWTPKNLPDGNYYFRLQAGEQMASGMMVLIQ